MKVEAFLNHHAVVIEVENDELLVDTLRKQGMSSVRRGCDTSCCGLCTVWIDGKPTLSCSVLSFRIQGKSIITIEGMQQEAEEFATVLAAEGAEQCGYCSPGFIMTVLAMKRELTDYSESSICDYLAGNLCRCTGYMGQMRAVKKYLGVARND